MYEISSAAIVGMGALGMLYGDRIQENLGRDALYFAVDDGRAARYSRAVFTVNNRQRDFRFLTPANCTPADLVIVAVKFTALTDALPVIRPLIGENTTIISVLNGISSEEILGEVFGMNRVIGCIAQGMDAVRVGRSLVYTRPGELRIGIMPQNMPAADSDRSRPETPAPAGSITAPSPDERLNALCRFLDRAGLAYTVENDIRYRLWSKFMLNVGINQTCLAYETTYAGALAPGSANDTFISAMQEVVTIANLEGIPLSQADIDSYIALVATLSPTGCPSMRQDGIAHRPSEVELFSGTVRILAKKHGVPVPVNDWLYSRIKEIEAAY